MVYALIMLQGVEKALINIPVLRTMEQYTLLMRLVIKSEWILNFE